MSIAASVDPDVPTFAWEALGFLSIVQCQMIPSADGCAVIVWLDEDVLVAEIWPDLASAVEQAAILRDVLVEQGCWLLVP